MGELLADYGYSIRVAISRELFAGASNNYVGIELKYPGQGHTVADPASYLRPPGASDFDVALVIQSGSGSSSYAPPLLQYGVPIMSGEHVCLSDRGKPGDIAMYMNGNDSNDDYGPPSFAELTNDVYASQYMKVTAAGKIHPIMQGIPLDALDRVKVMRDPYPEENAHVPAGGYRNWEYDYPIQLVGNEAACTTVLGVVDNHPTHACFAVANVGLLNSWGSINSNRLVHYFVCEGGSGDSRRCFNAVSDIGRVIFVRAAKWAMGETLQPYQPLGVIKVSQVGAKQIQLAWTGTTTKNYKILGTANILGPNNYLNWQTVAQDIHGVDGVDATTVKLDVSAGPQYAYLRVMPVP
jgi:hypothetical protein